MAQHDCVSQGPAKGEQCRPATSNGPLIQHSSSRGQCKAGLHALPPLLASRRHPAGRGRRRRGQRTQRGVAAAECGPGKPGGLCCRDSSQAADMLSRQIRAYLSLGAMPAWCLMIERRRRGGQGVRRGLAAANAGQASPASRAPMQHAGAVHSGTHALHCGQCIN